VSAPDEQQVWDALERVIDPCSAFNGTHLSLVELGMIEAVTIERGDVEVLLFLDDPTCVLFFEINRMISEEVGALEGVSAVSVKLKADEVWTEDRMTERGRSRLQAVRSQRRELHRRHGAKTPGWPLPMVQLAGDPLPMSQEAACSSTSTE
jgi:metal-sulfur cluster biosynthetic enzyme